MSPPISTPLSPPQEQPPEAEEEEEGSSDLSDARTSGDSDPSPSTYPTPTASDPDPPAVPKRSISSNSISTTSSASSTPSPFLLLPTELIFQISSVLPPIASCQLSLSCRRFRIIIGPVRLTRQQVYKELLEPKVSRDYAYHLINFGNKAFKRQNPILAREWDIRHGTGPPSSLKRRSSDISEASPSASIVTEQNFGSVKRRTIETSSPPTTETYTTMMTTARNAAAYHPRPYPPIPSPLATVPFKMRREISAPARLENDKCLRCIGTCVCLWDSSEIAAALLFWQD